jgi:hypothetical protein
MHAPDQEGKMTGLGTAEWNLAWGNIAVFVIACCITLFTGDPAAVIA